MNLFKGMDVEWHQPFTPPFLGAEFYDMGPVLTVTDPDTGRKIEVSRVGDACVGVGGSYYETPEEFRNGFPDGVLPGGNWISSGWFDLGGVENTDDVCLDLVDVSAFFEED